MKYATAIFTTVLVLFVALPIALAKVVAIVTLNALNEILNVWMEE